MLVGAITMIFTGITIIFLKQLCFGLWLTLPLLLSLASGITLLGMAWEGRRANVVLSTLRTWRAGQVR